MADVIAQNRLAILFSDGSLGVHSEAISEAQACEEALGHDRNETDPAGFSRVVRVNVELVEAVATPSMDAWRAGQPSGDRLSAYSTDELLVELQDRARAGDPAAQERPQRRRARHG